MKNNSSFVSTFIILTLIFASFVNVNPAYAAGTVGSGTPASCTEAALNTALIGGGAVSFNCGAAPLTITITTTKTIASNTQIDGGGLITISGGNAVRLFIVNSSIIFNVTNLTLSDGFISDGNGGAININSSATVNISNSTFSHNNTVGTTLNSIGYGGAIYVDSAALNITNSTFNNNGANVEKIGDYALGGGAIQNNNGTVTISGSTFTGNFVDSYTADGGAIYNGDFNGGPGVPDNNPDILTITNSTFYNNLLKNTAATVTNSGSSAGAIRSASTLTITHSTFSNNDSGLTELGGEAGAVTITRGTAILTNNIFANSTAADCAVRSEGVIDASSAGNLIESDLGCGASVSSNDPVLGSLQNNGGPTQTMALGVSSPAINAITSCTVSTDQRGVVRPQPIAGNCDIGAYELDSTLPTVTNVTSTTANGTYTTPSVIAVTVTFSENVTVTGTPQLTLETGTIDRTANYASGSGTATLTFNYTVQAGDASSDLDYVATTSLALNGGTIKDAATNNATLTLSTPGASGSLSANKAIVIDAIVPTVSMSSVTSNPTNASPIAVTVTFSESVSGFTSGDITAGNGTISNFAGTGASYTFDLAPSASGLVTADIPASAAQDAAGNNSTAATQFSRTYDTVAPTVTNVTSTTANGTYTTLSVIAVTVTFSENVTVTGTPQLTLETGTIDRTANYASGSGTAALTFNYTVQAGDASSDLDYVATTSLALNGGTIKDAATNNATLTLSTPGASGSLSANKAIVIDANAPTVTNVTSTTANGTYTTPSVIAVTVTFSENVTVTGTPQLTLETGTIDRTANYASGSGTATLTFNYTVQAGDASSDLDYVATTSLALNGGTIKDAATNNATLTLSTPGASGSLSANKAIVIDAIVPTVSMSSVTSNPTNASPIAVTVTFSESVSGFTSGDITAGNGTISNFAGTGASYTFDLAPSASGLVTADIPASAAQDAAGNNSTAATQFSRTYDTVAPTVTNVTSTTANGTYTTLSVIAVTVTFSENVTVTGTPQLTLETGTIDRTANYASGSGTAALTFNYTVQAGDASSDLDYVATTSLALNGGTIKDAATNNATLTLSTPGASGSLSANKAIVIDANAPTVTISSTITSPTNTSLIPITITFSKSVTGFVIGDITVGNGTASNFAGSGAVYTVDITPTSNSTITIDVAGSVAQDSASNGNLAAAQFSITFDNTNPNVSSIIRVSTSPTNAASVNFTVTFIESVTGVDVGDFVLTTTGISGASIAGVSGSGATYTATVNTGSGNGTIRLDVLDNDSIKDAATNPLGGAGGGNGNFTSGEIYTVNRSSTFGDVPNTHPYYNDIEILYANGYTGGCLTSPLMYCPDVVMNRAQAAVFMMRGNFGGSYLPPSTPSHIFADSWTKAPWGETWAEAMFNAGLTAGCSSSPLKFCPDDQLTNAQAAVFGLRLKYGTFYNPPAASGTVFADLTDLNFWGISWAEQAYADGLLPACGTSGGKPKFCPDALVNRGFGASIIVKAKNLTMP